MDVDVTRRRVLAGACCGALVAGTPGARALAQSRLGKRLEWEVFKKTSQYASFVTAIKKMRANANATDKNSWTYWANIHVNSCPHGIAYFLAWHRGYLKLFEQQLRIVSGNSNLMLPYWNYYKNSSLPAEFTNPASANPLYVVRTNNDVSQALTLAPFAADVTALPRGASNAFESSVEDMPHNPVHDIIGGIMADMQSPMDPIFWLHHANIDRLWSAWVFAAKGRLMPLRTNAYWDGTFSYAFGVSMNRRATIDTRVDMSYCYDNEIMPTVLPSAAFGELATAAGGEQGAEPAMPGTQAVLLARVPSRPPIGPFDGIPMYPRGASRLALGGANRIALGDRSVSARIPLTQDARTILRKVLATARATEAAPATPTFNMVKVTLERPRLTAMGIGGGFFYKLYMNLPPSGAEADSEEKFYLGTVGPFQLAQVRQHEQSGHASASSLSFSATSLMRRFSAAQLDELTVSFVRVNGNNAPKGDVVTISECLLEVAQDS